MPKYDFQCPNCGTIEIVKSMSDDDPTNCPDCDAAISRVWGGMSVGIAFKGSGFYKTDSRKKNG